MNKNKNRSTYRSLHVSKCNMSLPKEDPDFQIVVGHIEQMFSAQLKITRNITLTRAEWKRVKINKWEWKEDYIRKNITHLYGFKTPWRGSYYIRIDGNPGSNVSIYRSTDNQLKTNEISLSFSNNQVIEFYMRCYASCPYSQTLSFSDQTPFTIYVRGIRPI
jgi:hypothetical protein